jgi:hypothetical protein
MDIDTLARRAGRFRWIEGALFETLGSWLGDTPEPAVREFFGVQCQRHAWHAQLWQQRQPALPGVEPDALVAPAHDAWVDFVTALRRPTATVERLAGITRVVLPRLIAAATTFLADHDARTDGPTVRVLTLIQRDDLDAWQDGERFVLGLLVDAGAVARVAAHTARLEVLATAVNPHA